MITRPKKGSVEWVKLDEVFGSDAYAGVELGVKYVGGKLAREWTMRAVGIRNQENARLAAMRKGVCENENPDLFSPGALTEDGLRDWMTFLEGVFDQLTAGVKGIDGVTGEAGAKEFVGDLGVHESILLFYRTLGMQTPTQAQIFTEGAGHVATV